MTYDFLKGDIGGLLLLKVEGLVVAGIEILPRVDNFCLIRGFRV